VPSKNRSCQTQSCAANDAYKQWGVRHGNSGGARRADRADAYLVAEVSASVNETDVARAQRRAAIVTRVTGLPVLAVVAGQSIRLDADEAARAAGLWRVVNGVTLAPSDAVPPERLTRES
jgi:hypothetical protein